MTRTRFAPSPTGFLHIGGLRTALYAFALARHEGGKFLLRIEDTDQKREVPEAQEKIFEILKTFGLNWDGEPLIQSQRVKTGEYRRAADRLLEKGHAFYCDCPPRNAKLDGYSTVLRDPCRDKHLTSGAVKLRVPDGETVSYYDFVIDKEVAWQTDKVADTILLKSDSFPTYHLAVVVDDSEMEISHVIRGVEWLTSTPIHLLVYRFLGLVPPQIGHPSAILDPSGGKLSKRKGHISVEWFLEAGYLPEALLNFVILLGWAPKDNRELFTLEEFVKYFDPKGFQKSNPVFHTNKLDWFNGHYIRTNSDTELTRLVKPYVKDSGIEEAKLTQIVAITRERLVKLSDFPALTAFFYTTPSYNPDLWKDPAQSLSHLTESLPVLTDSAWAKEPVENNLKNLVSLKGLKTGDFYMSLRIAICGSRITPPLTESMIILGKEESLARVQKAITFLESSI